MQTITQSRRKNSAAGEPIHLPFACMISTKTFIRRGELTLIAAGPGTGKSAFVQAIAQRGNDRGDLNTSIYFSFDTDSSTMFKRAASIHSGWNQSDVENIMENGDRKGVEAAVSKATSHMRWSFESSPTEEAILLEIEAYAATFGEFPEILIFDNTKDISMGVGEGEFQMLEEACVFMKGLARDTNAAVIALHHCIGAMEDGLTPIPLSGLRGKISKTPATILTLHRADAGKQLRVSPVKVRSGVADASGNWSLPITIDLNRMSFTG